MDLTAVVTEIGDLTSATGPVQLIGGALLLLGVAFLVYKTARRMLGR